MTARSREFQFTAVAYHIFQNLHERFPRLSRIRYAFPLDMGTQTLQYLLRGCRADIRTDQQLFQFLKKILVHADKHGEQIIDLAENSLLCFRQTLL